MTHFHVFVDTNVLPQKPTQLSSFVKRLSDLVQLKLVTVYLPYVVYAEWRSQWQSAYKQDMKDVHKKLAELNQWFQGMDLGTTIHNLYECLSPLRKQREHPESLIEALVQQLQANILYPREHHAQSILDAYFQGVRPFKNVKNRQDFPDAFIFECIRDVAQEHHDSVYVLTADEGLQKACNEHLEVSVRTSIKDFVEDSAVVQAALRIEDPEGAWLTFYDKRRTRLPELQQDIVTFLQNEEPHMIILRHIDVEHEDFPSDNNDARITSMYAPYDIEADWEYVETFEPGMITVPIQFAVDADVTMQVYRGDTFDVPEGVSVSWGDFETEHFFEASASVSLRISGSIMLEFAWESYDWSDEGFPPLEDILFEDVTDVNVVEQETGTIFL